MIGLADLYNSEYFEHWRESEYNNMCLTDPERRDRIDAAAENGAEGSTHGEIIEDWRQCLNSLYIRYKDFDEPEDYITDIENGIITEEDRDSIEKEIDDCEAWHEANGSLDQEVG